MPQLLSSHTLERHSAVPTNMDRLCSTVLMHPGQPLPGEGASLAQVSAVGRLLYLGLAQPAQEGTYTCECSNVAGNSSEDQQLVVYGESDWDDLDQAERAGRGQPDGWATRHPHKQVLQTDGHRSLSPCPRGEPPSPAT